MAIITQYPYIDGNGNEKEDLIKTYSNTGLYILQNETGEVYEEAVDLYPSRYTYTETSEYIDGEGIDYQTAYNNLAAEVMNNE